MTGPALEELLIHLANNQMTLLNVPFVYCFQLHSASPNRQCSIMFDSICQWQNIQWAVLFYHK